MNGIELLDGKRQSYILKLRGIVPTEIICWDMLYLLLCGHNSLQGATKACYVVWCLAIFHVPTRQLEFAPVRIASLRLMFED
jgi:hypothetical protein